MHPDNIELTVIYDNNSCHDCDLESLWGFSCYVHTPNKTILFDTGGEGKALFDNLHKREIDSSSIDDIFISHNHWDHIGGINYTLAKKPKANIYVTKILKKIQIENQIIIDEDITQIADNIYSTGALGNVKEHSLILNTTLGLIIITGCSHVGIEKISKKAMDKLQKNVLFVIGGFHLINREKERIFNVIDMIEDGKIKYICPLHCTGEKAQKIFKRRVPNQYIDGHLNSKIIFKNGIPTLNTK